MGSARAGRASLHPTHWTSGLDHDEYADRVTTVLDLLRAGECYQVNLTRRLTCDDAINPIARPFLIRLDVAGWILRERHGIAINRATAGMR